MNIFMGAPTRGKVKAMLMWGGMRASKQGLLFEIQACLRAQQFYNRAEYE
jgi:hypothetical protein